MKDSPFWAALHFFFVPLRHSNLEIMAKKVLFINQEITPYVPETLLSTMGLDLPQKAQEAGLEIRTFMPKWGNINERRGQLHEVIRLSGMNLVIDDTDHTLIIKVASIPQSRIQVYFIDNDDYFTHRQMTVDEHGAEYEDNGERAIFFARGVLETVKKLRWTPDIIHCQGWMSAVIPFYLKTAYKEEPTFAHAKVVTSLFSEQPKSNFGKKFKSSVVYKEAKNKFLKAYDDKFDYLELGKLAIDYSDGIIEANTGVATELLAHATNKNIPLLNFPGDDFMDAYAAFYEKIYPSAEE